MKKSLKVFLVLLISLLFTSYTFAATSVSKSSATMALVKDEVCDINFGTYGSFEKKMVNIDTNNKTIDISLTVKNNAEPKEVVAPAGEVVLLIDSSNSMDVNEVESGVTRRTAVYNSATTLVNKLFSVNPDIKIGVVQFATVPIPEDGSPITVGTEDDAEILTQLTNSKSTVQEKLDYYSTHQMGATTNIDAGIKKAKDVLAGSTDSSAKKYIVLLSDGIPNISLSSGNVIEYSDTTVNNTKTALESAESAGYNIISMLIDVYNTGYPMPQNFSEGTLTNKEVAEKAFGSETNPTAGVLYYVNDSEVTNTVSNLIYNDLMPETDNSTVLTDVVIKDYFPQNIVDNFNFDYVTRPDKGTVEQSGDLLTWTIPELRAGESSTFTYRLSLKDSFNGDIVDLNLPTNRDVTIDYKEGGIPGEQKHNDKCPVVKLTVPSKPGDPTTADKPIPQTGSNTWLIVGSLVALGVAASVFGIVKSYKFRK